MGSEQLLGRIRSDGRDKVARVEAERDREVTGIRERFASEVKELEREFGERIERETRQELERAKSRARLDARKELLRARWQVIGEVFDRAGKQVLDDKEYPRLLEQLVGRFATGDARVRFSARDQERLGKKLGVKTGDSADISGGLVVEQGRQFLDFSVGESLGAIRDELAPKLAQQLFPGPEN
jgi:vacuolar-type H+-ATPase subunit E/Vma4